MQGAVKYTQGLNGTFLPTQCANTRITADVMACMRLALDSRQIVRNIRDVVYALPLGALFASLFRYPSPKGRLHAFLHEPSFFSCRFAGCANGRGIAQAGHLIIKAFDLPSILAFCAAQEQQEIRGKFTCDASFLHSRFWPRLRPAETRRWSNRSLGPARGWVQLQYWTATWRRVPLSALRATCSTASPTRAAADPRTAVVDATATKPQHGKNCFFSHWLSPVARLIRRQWGASTERGAEYGHSSKSSNLVSSIGGVQRPRRVEPHGFRPVFADSDYRITAFPGLPRPVKCNDHADKAQDLPKGGPCALSFSDDKRRDERCSRRS